MYLGRYQLGQYVPLRLVTQTVAGAPTLPDAAPTLYTWSGTSKIETLLVPAIDQKRTTAMFFLPLFLGSLYAVGNYRVVYQWANSSVTNQAVDTFEIVTGGDALGDVAAMHAYDCPDGTFVVRQVGRGLLTVGRGPHV